MIPLPHITRRQLVFSLILSIASLVFLLTSLILRPTDPTDPSSLSTGGRKFDPWAVKSSAAEGIRWVVPEKVRANFGFGSGYIPVNERPLAEDQTGAGLFDITELETGLYASSSSSSGSSSSVSSSRLGLSHGWNTVKNKSSSVWTSLGNTLSSSSFPNPFSSSSSSSRPRVTDWDDLPFENKAFKEWEYSRGLIYEGTGARVQRFLEKARSGRGFVVAVVGGSVSKGRGLPKVPFDVEVGRYVVGGSSSSPSSEEETGEKAPRHQHGRRLVSSSFPQDRDPSKTQNLYNPFNMHMQVFEYLDDRFPAMPLEYGEMRPRADASSNSNNNDGDDDDEGAPLLNLTSGVEPGHQTALHRSHHRGENQFINGAQGGVGSDYFAGCWKEHLGEDVDLVIVELGINDARSLEVMENYELLLRSLLEMGSRPAVINVQ